MKKFIFNSKNLLIALYLLVAFFGGFCVGLRIGYMDGSQHTTEIRNQMLDLKPYDASLQIMDIKYNDISPAGATISFATYDLLDNLTCEWTIYPSDVFIGTTVKDTGKNHSVRIDTYPEGGTLMFRILEGDLEDNRGSLWFYIDLPRSNDPNAIMPPPYLSDNENVTLSWSKGSSINNTIVRYKHVENITGIAGGGLYITHYWSEPKTYIYSRLFGRK